MWRANQILRLNSKIFAQQSSLISSRNVTTWKASKVEQGGLLQIDTSKISSPLDIEIITRWEEYCELSSPQDGVDAAFSESDDTKSLELIVHSFPADSTTPNKLIVHIPELYNVSVKGNHANTSIKNKLMGDLSIQCQDGNIAVDKVKGENIKLSNLQGDTVIRKVLEGGVEITCNNLTAKMINGDHVHITATSNAVVGAIYGKHTGIFANGKVQVDLFKGNLEAKTVNGGIYVKSIDGSFDLEADQGDIEIQINKLHSNENSTDFENNNNHFSSAMAKNGNVNCLVDPEIRCTLICESSDDSEDNIDISSDAFELELLDEEHQRVEGRLTGVSKAVKRPRFESSSSTGKIDLGGAEQSQGHGVSNVEYVLQLLATGKVSVQTMSWIEVIRRKHGFLNEDEGTLPPGYQRRK